MTEQFRQVAPLHFGPLIAAEVTPDGALIASQPMSVEQARELVTWLQSALPCAHSDKRVRFVNGQIVPLRDPHPYICRECGEHLSGDSK